ncbi:glycoside hydrolase family 16 protein [Lentiprolixibacter aurantiacus]|uniref:Glycoside hydrolase family 16 protein n=1 Tax=Lentiprolixibacter aurantiacus TaxID=2993939 RepID=A0AAE3SN44_9FLAO|nr:glycoside hydrolase family 16 protein [Lentiprolixibacter aurantiacus]MCX2718037.1 glycoside hydrolase family 16 protein [Lentiprolixibacter aurantiacus]
MSILNSAFTGQKLIGFIFLFVAGITFSTSCSNSSSEAGVTSNVPTNLSISVTIVGADDQNPSGDGSGEVLIVATARNTKYFILRVGSDSAQQSTTGSFSYTVNQGGTQTYTAEVFAYSDSGESISRSATFEVFKEQIEPFSSLVFSDEFDYEGSPDANKWHHQTIPIVNGTDWANGEQQHYTARIENSYVSSGTLKIKAIKESYTASGTTKEFTSARLNSKFAFKYGRVEVRAKLPAEAGTWPAIWTLGANINEVGNYFGDQYGSVGWPACGEIDIMEQRGWDKNTTIGFFHWGHTSTGVYNNEGGDIPISNASSEYHVFALEWDETTMKILVDDTLVYELSNTADKPYDNEHYLLLNIAMGGNLGGNIPRDFTESIMEIDYVRVYQ